MADLADARSTASLISPDHPAWSCCADLYCEFTVEVVLPSVTIADLLALKIGSVVASRCKVGSDVPARVNGVVIAGCEFEVVGSRLAVRFTDLA